MALPCGDDSPGTSGPKCRPAWTVWWMPGFEVRVSRRQCAGATIRRASTEAAGEDAAQGGCVCGTPRRGGGSAAQDRDGLRAAVGVVRVPECPAPRWDRSRDIHVWGGTGSGRDVGGNPCIDQKLQRLYLSPTLGPRGGRSPQRSRSTGRESGELTDLVGLLLGERAWRSAAYAASPFLIVMVRIVSHPGSVNHLVTCLCHRSRGVQRVGHGMFPGTTRSRLGAWNSQSSSMSTPVSKVPRAWPRANVLAEPSERS